MAHEGMVHALQECWRVLCPGGQLLDVRPLGVDRDVEVIAAEEVFHAGIVDVSRGLADDEAADATMQRVVAEGLYTRENGRTFTITNYWASLAEMQSHVQERWADFATVPGQTLVKANAFVQAQKGQPIRIAVRGPIQMVSYRPA